MNTEKIKETLKVEIDRRDSAKQAIENLSKAVQTTRTELTEAEKLLASLIKKAESRLEKGLPLNKVDQQIAETKFRIETLRERAEKLSHPVDGGRRYEGMVTKTGEKVSNAELVLANALKALVQPDKQKAERIMAYYFDMADKVFEAFNNELAVVIRTLQIQGLHPGNAELAPAPGHDGIYALFANGHLGPGKTEPLAPEPEPEILEELPPVEHVSHPPVQPLTDEQVFGEPDARLGTDMSLAKS
jgi:hypothetical protein